MIQTNEPKSALWCYKADFRLYHSARMGYVVALACLCHLSQLTFLDSCLMLPGFVMKDRAGGEREWRGALTLDPFYRRHMTNLIIQVASPCGRRAPTIGSAALCRLPRCGKGTGRNPCWDSLTALLVALRCSLVQRRTPPWHLKRMERGRSQLGSAAGLLFSETKQEDQKCGEIVNLACCCCRPDFPSR